MDLVSGSSSNTRTADSSVAFLSVAVCNMSVHKRCHKNVANNCGINTKQMAEILSTMGISPNTRKVSTVQEVFFKKVKSGGVT